MSAFHPKLTSASDPLRTLVTRGKLDDMGAQGISGWQILATVYWWLALAAGFLLSAMLVSAGVAFNFPDFDVTSPLTLWAIILIANPFAALAIRHIYRANFDRAQNLAFLATGVLTLVVLHATVMLYLDT